MSGPKRRDFWSWVDRSDPDPDGCWIWTGQRNDEGYGRHFIGTNKRTRYKPAHRTAYELTVGPIPSGMVLDHLCRNHACVNPAHLEPVSHRMNILRGTGAPALNAAKTHCVRGHPLSGENVRVRRSDGRRECRSCARDRDRAYRTKLRLQRKAVSA